MPGRGFEVISPERDWYRLSPLSLLLLPLAALFGAVVWLRRKAFRAGLLRSHDAGVPVVVVGNVAVGGTGKTPLVIWLAHFLRRHGLRPGIVSRGYGGEGHLMEVLPDTDPVRAGDEPVLLAQRSGCPVWIGRDRVAAVRALLARHPGCNVVISDDGLQHYRLRRNFEIAVVDGERGLGNRLLLPAGPLREPASRLGEVDAVVVNGDSTANIRNAHDMALEGRLLRNLLDPSLQRAPEAFRGQRLHAVAAIGNPARFFAALTRLGLRFKPHAFADHHAFTPADLDFADADAILMTEKDAIKCQRFARPNFWTLPVEARVAASFGQLVLDKLKAPHGS
jgi:tetraacyldisaccharide 4'-kinase